MTTDQTNYAQARKLWLEQNKTSFAVRQSHVLRKRPNASVNFKQLLAAMTKIGDIFRNRASEVRHACDESGRQQYGDGFALVDRDVVGLLVRVRETGQSDGPSHSYFHAVSVGLHQLVLEADLALLHDVTLQLISTPEILTIDIKANLLHDRIDAIHSTIARECSRLGYTSDSHANIDIVDALWKQPDWPGVAGWPLKRLTLQLGSGEECPAPARMLAALARIYGALNHDGAAPSPTPLQTTGAPGLGRYFVLARDATHGLKFVLDAVDEPEQCPRGQWGISLRSVGLPDLFVSSKRVMSIGINDAPTTMQVDTRMEFCVTASEDDKRLQQGVDAIVAQLASLGYSLNLLETSTAGNYPD